MTGRGLFVLLIVGFAIYIAAPLLLPVAMGAVFAVLLSPWVRALERRKLSTVSSSLLLILGSTLLLVLPSIVLIFIGTRAGLAQLHVFKDASPTGSGTFFSNLLNQPAVHSAFEKISTWFPIQVEETISAAEDMARSIGLRLTDTLGDLLTHIPGLVVGLIIMVISTFYFLVDGPKINELIRRNSVFGTEQTEVLMHSFAKTCRGVILATVVSGLAQAFLYGIGCLLVGKGNSLLIGLLVFLASFVPLVGSAPITFGVAFSQIFVGNQVAAIVLIVLAVVVALVDNLIRPMILRGSGNLHPLLAFVAVFGGLQMLGFAGVFLGPIIMALAVTTLNGVLKKKSPPPTAAA